MTYDEIAEIIWNNHPNLKKDNIRFHISGYHITKDNKISISTFIEESLIAIDLGNPNDIGINISSERWYSDYFNNIYMLSAISKKIFKELKPYGNFDFKEPKDWATIIKNNEVINEMQT